MAEMFLEIARMFLEIAQMLAILVLAALAANLLRRVREMEAAIAERDRQSELAVTKQQDLFSQFELQEVMR